MKLTRGENAINHCEAHSSLIDKTNHTDKQIRKWNSTVSRLKLSWWTGAWKTKWMKVMRFSFLSLLPAQKARHHRCRLNKITRWSFAGSMIYYENNRKTVSAFFSYMGKVLIGSTDLPVTDLNWCCVCTDDEVGITIFSLHFIPILPELRSIKNKLSINLAVFDLLGSASKKPQDKFHASHQLQVSNV